MPRCCCSTKHSAPATAGSASVRNRCCSTRVPRDAASSSSLTASPWFGGCATRGCGWRKAWFARPGRSTRWSTRTRRQPDCPRRARRSSRTRSAQGGSSRSSRGRRGLIRIAAVIDTFDVGGFELACLELLSRLDPDTVQLEHLRVPSRWPGRTGAHRRASRSPSGTTSHRPTGDGRPPIRGLDCAGRISLRPTWPPTRSTCASCGAGRRQSARPRRRVCRRSSSVSMVRRCRRAWPTSRRAPG